MSNPTKEPKSLEERLEKRVARKRDDVFLRADFSDLGTSQQIGRGLRRLVAKGLLIRIGQGLYARARPSTLDGKPVLEHGLATLKDALRRLGVEVVPTRFEEAYNAGLSEQVPTGRVVGVRGRRVRRKIGYDGVYLRFEHAARNRPKPRAGTKRHSTAPISMRAALRLIWEADSYPISGNEDWRISSTLMEEALASATRAVSSSDDPPEFAVWLAALRDSSSPEKQREEAMTALYDLFDPEP